MIYCWFGSLSFVCTYYCFWSIRFAFVFVYVRLAFMLVGCVLVSVMRLMLGCLVVLIVLLVCYCSFWCCFSLLFRFTSCDILYMWCLFVCFVVYLFCLLFC